jgi:small ligand-binding sensory domain FIST
MKSRQMFMVSISLVFLSCFMFFTFAHADDFGIGKSTLTDAEAAGLEAAQAAKAALDGPAKLVLVFNEGSLAENADDLLAGVAQVFDSSIIYGSNGYAVIAGDTSDATVAILAVSADDISVAVATAEANAPEDDRPCGQAIGRSLAEAYDAAEDQGKFLLLLGDCHVPRDNDVVLGVRDVLGDDVTALGAAALGGHTYIQGEVVRKANVGILVSGPFECGYSLKQDMSEEGLIGSARQAMSEALRGKPEAATIVLVFDCGGRRGAMIKNGNFEDELATMQDVAGDIPLFGFYGSGEIGRPVDEPSKGVGYHIGTGAVLVE